MARVRHFQSAPHQSTVLHRETRNFRESAKRDALQPGQDFLPKDLRISLVTVLGFPRCLILHVLAVLLSSLPFCLATPERIPACRAQLRHLCSSSLAERGGMDLLVRLQARVTVHP